MTTTTVSFPNGTGNNSNVFSKDVVGVLLELKAPKKPVFVLNGQECPSSHIAIFADGTRFNWSSYFLMDVDGNHVLDSNGNKVIKPWDQFDETIDLGACRRDGVCIHLWKDENGRQHLELA